MAGITPDDLWTAVGWLDAHEYDDMRYASPKDDPYAVTIKKVARWLEKEAQRREDKAGKAKQLRTLVRAGTKAYAEAGYDVNAPAVKKTIRKQAQDVMKKHGW